VPGWDYKPSLHRRTAPSNINASSVQSHHRTRPTRRQQIEFMDKLLENTHNRITWPVITSFLEAAMSENTSVYKHQSYINLLWAEERGDLINTLESQAENMKIYGLSFNRWLTRLKYWNI
jgi:hypothetical protein